LPLLWAKAGELCSGLCKKPRRGGEPEGTGNGTLSGRGALLVQVHKGPRVKQAEALSEKRLSKNGMEAGEEIEAAVPQFATRGRVETPRRGTEPGRIQAYPPWEIIDFAFANPGRPGET